MLGAVLTALALMLALVTVAPAPAAIAALPAPSNPQPADDGWVDGIPVFTWSAVQGAAKYRIQVAADEAFTALRYEAEVVASSAAPKADFVPGTYYWRVQPMATDGSGSYPATPWMFTRSAADGPILVSPTDGKVLDYPEEPPVLRWTPMSGVTGYELQTSTSNTFPSGSATTTRTVASSSYALTALEPQDRVLYWRVRANYLTATSKTGTTTSKTEWSPTWSFSTDWEGAGVENSTPDLLTPAKSSATEDAITHPPFHWTPVDGATQYRLQISAAPDFTDLRINRTLGRTTYVGPGSLEAGAYYWRVAALDERGSQAPWSDVWDFYRGWLDAEGNPARPTVTATDADPAVPGIQMARDEFLVAWTAVPGASHYEVEISDNPSFTSGSAKFCETPHTALTSIRDGAYRRSTRLSPCDFYATATGFDIADHNTVHVRVRAVDATTGSASYPGAKNPVVEVYSMWSNHSRWSGDPLPGPLTLNLTEPSGGDPMNAPATIIGPANLSQHTDAPVLSWNRVEGAHAYLVALSTDRNFTSSELGNGDSINDYVVVRGTRLVLLEALKDNTAGQSFYWYVLPCESFVSMTTKQCPIGDEQAVNQEGRYRSFRKVALAPRGLVDPDHAQGPPVEIDGEDVRLAWDDLLATEIAAEGGNADPTRSFEKGGLKHYQLEISRDPDFSDTTKRVLLTTTDATEIVPDVAWDQGETYYWRVRGIDGGGNELAWSTEECTESSEVACSFQFTTSNAPPADLEATASAPVPSLSWGPRAASSFYEVQVFTGTDAQFPLGNKVAEGTSEYSAWTPGSLPPGTYSWRVRKVDALGARGDWSAPTEPYWTFEVGTDDVVPTAPANGAALATKQLSFDWDPVLGAARYELQVSTRSDFATVYESAVTANTAWTPTLSNGYAAGRYYWRVRALSSATSNNVLAQSASRTLDVRTPPGRVTGVSTELLGRGSVRVSWTPRPTQDGGVAVAGYSVWYRRATETNWGTPRTLWGNVGNAALSGLADDTAYQFKVAAFNTLGAGPESATVRASTPGAPTAPRVTVTARDHGLRVSWSGSSSKLPISSYQVWYKPVAAATWTKRSAAKSPLELTGLSPTTAYQVQVAAINAVKIGPFGTATPVRPLATPSAPQAVTLRPGSGQVTVTWAPPATPGSSAVTGYVVAYKKLSATTWSQRSSTTRSAVLTGLTAGQTYAVRVSARNAVGIGPQSPELRFVARVLPKQPTTVTAKVAGRKKVRTMTVTWRPPTVGAPFTSYEVQVAVSGRAWSTIARTAATKAVWRKARKGRTYTVRVRALNSLGWGPFSSVVSVRA